MARGNDRDRGRRAPRDDRRRPGKKKVCIFCAEHLPWVDYKEVNLLRRFMSDRGKIRARRVTGNCAQHQREVAVAIKTARELALLPYATRVSSSRGGRGGGGRGRDRDDRGPSRDERPPRPGPGDAPPPAPRGGAKSADAPTVQQETVVESQ